MDSLHQYQILHHEIYNKLVKIGTNMLAINIKVAKRMTKIFISEFSCKSMTLILSHSLSECQQSSSIAQMSVLLPQRLWVLPPVAFTLATVHGHILKR